MAEIKLEQTVKAAFYHVRELSAVGKVWTRPLCYNVIASHVVSHVISELLLITAVSLFEGRK